MIDTEQLIHMYRGKGFNQMFRLKGLTQMLRGEGATRMYRWKGSTQMFRVHGLTQMFRGTYLNQMLRGNVSVQRAVLWFCLPIFVMPALFPFPRRIDFLGQFQGRLLV